MTLEACGYAVVPAVLSREEVLELREELARVASEDDRKGGVRSLGLKSEAVRELAVNGVPAALAREVLGSAARPVKVTAFDKTAGANWIVPWHQDLTIAVREKRSAEGFGPWSVKDGIPHVQPPIEVLSRMLAVRVHLDETPADHGALRVIPGSHRLGRIAAGDIPEWRTRLGEVTCPVGEGGAMLMRPLLLHASSKSRTGEHRRVIHIEYAGFDLPCGLQWVADF
ncbi:MAG: phytanoyl-CoA dioxygenase family protein [Thermoanaerobaculia bacterium]